MGLLDASRNNRILVVDDNEAIHQDFDKILKSSHNAGSAELDEFAATLFDEERPTHPHTNFQPAHAMQGQEALELVLASLEAETPFALAFVDVRMPPGWNGVETVERIWQHDREIEIVLCTAYSDFSWEEIAARLTEPDRLLILRKPFDPLEVRQLAYGLTAKWWLRRLAACRMQDLEIMVEDRTAEINALRARLEHIAHQQRNDFRVT
jgi:CheY-like chemotaxis protein